MVATGSRARTRPGGGTVSRAIQVLRVVAESESGISASEVAAVLGLPRATAHRLLRLLVAEGVVALDPSSRRYRLGPELARIAAIVSNSFSLPETARPFMESIVRACDETCLLGVYVPHSGTYHFALEVPGSHPLGYRTNLNVAFPVEWGAAGRSIVAYLPPAEADVIVAQMKPSPGTGEPPPPADAFRRELEAIRTKGYAHTSNHYPGSCGIGAAVLDLNGYPIASLCLSIPDVRFERGSESVLGPLVAEHAIELSRILGHRPEKGGADGGTRS